MNRISISRQSGRGQGSCRSYEKRHSAPAGLWHTELPGRLKQKLDDSVVYLHKQQSLSEELMHYQEWIAQLQQKKQESVLFDLQEYIRHEAGSLFEQVLEAPVSLNRMRCDSIALRDL